MRKEVLLLSGGMAEDASVSVARPHQGEQVEVKCLYSPAQYHII